MEGLPLGFRLQKEISRFFFQIMTALQNLIFGVSSNFNKYIYIHNSICVGRAGVKWK